MNNNLHVNGTITCAGLVAPASTITNSMIQAAAGIDATKVIHQHQKGLFQVHGSAATSERKVVHVARAAGTLTEFVAGVVVACIGAATVTVDLRKNGTTVLTGTILIDSTDAAYAINVGTLASTSYVAGDVYEVVTVATAGGGTLGQGLFAQATLRENPQ